ncbi:MAG: hypothetical protein ABI462_03370 [Ignavibacteria bacterium]
MKLFNNLSKLQIAIFSLLVCISGVLGYLFYDSYRINIQNRSLIAESKVENKDLSQDLDIVKDKYERLKTEVDVLKDKVRKVSYKKKTTKKRHLYSAGKSSKNKKYYKRQKVNYKKLYFQLKNNCYKDKSYSRTYTRKR